jgi:bile-acid 7alpha-dehydratase
MNGADELEAIKRLKYKYLRCLDLKLWSELAECFAEDAVSAYSGGKYSFDGRDAIMEFLEKAMGAPSFLSSHTVHHPEIEFTSESTATGIWALHDVVIETKADIVIQGAAFYHDEYVKVDGEWKIRSTGYERTYEETLSRADVPSLKITANRFADS